MNNTKNNEQTKAVDRYFIENKLLTNPQRDINIVRMNDGLSKKICIQ